jgi:hypothetical protein
MIFFGEKSLHAAIITSRAISMQNVITTGSAIGHPLRVTKWAELRVRLLVGSISVDCCATAIDHAE